MTYKFGYLMLIKDVIIGSVAVYENGQLEVREDTVVCRT
jgi:hypothetical protein